MAGRRIELQFSIIIFCSIITLSVSSSVSPSSPPYSPESDTISISPSHFQGKIPPSLAVSPGLPPSPYPSLPFSPANPGIPVSPESFTIIVSPSFQGNIPPLPSLPSLPVSPSYPSLPPSPAYGSIPLSPAYLGSPATPALPATPYYPGIPLSPVQHPIPYPPKPAIISSPPYPGIPLSPVQHPIPYPPQPAIISSPPYPGSPISRPPYPATIPPTQGVKAAYWPSFDSFPVTSIDTSYFTHIYYAFLLPDPNTYKLSITENDEDMLPLFVSTLKSQKPLVKTLLSMGGGGNDPKVFSAIASTSSNRAIFIQNTIDVARQYGFDGLDLDWEFPANQQDMVNLGVLYKEWRKELNKEARATGRTRLLLTSAVYFASNFFSYGAIRSYPSDSIRRYVDWVSPMCFDYWGKWVNVTGNHATLYDPNSNISTSYGIQSWIGSGIPPQKLVMGLPLYGRSWTLKDPNVHGIGAPAVGVGPGSPDGTITYSGVVEFNSASHATEVYDEQRACPYSFAGSSWIGYDNPISVKKKIQFAQDHGLRGYFFWALGQDKDWTISSQASSAWEH